MEESSPHKLAKDSFLGRDVHNNENTCSGCLNESLK